MREDRAVCMHRRNARTLALPVAVTAGVVLPANPRRIALIVTRASTGTVFVSLGEPAVSQGGIAVTSAPYLGLLHRREFGTAITSEVWAIGTAAATLACVEITGDCDCD